MTHPDSPSSPAKPRSVAWALFGLSCLAGALNFGLFLWSEGDVFTRDAVFAAFAAVALTQFGLAVAAIVFAVKAVRAKQGGWGPLVLGSLSLITTPLGWAAGVIAAGIGGMGGAWGRPLRVRGRQLHPNLRDGADWTRGARPDAGGLDAPTREALAALWLHDAQKEHASVPAFSRIAWMLAAVGAPAELLEGAHQAALEEIEHTRLCFALAAGYAGRSRTVEAMPDLLLGMEFGPDPMVTLAVESLEDGCMLEDYNADVAAACAEACREPVTRDVLETIAVEERSHAAFSWAVLRWAVATDEARVRPAIEQALDRLEQYPRPTAVSHQAHALVDRADAAALRAHGRLPDEAWAKLWHARLSKTRAGVRALLAADAARAA
ncbi:MAG: hypothetical protein AAGA54_15830 [Myxococcota bacterium]